MAAVIHIGEPAPDFTLKDLKGIPTRLSEQRGQIILLYFWSAECPWVERCDREMSSLAEEWGKAIKILRISSNSNETPEMLQEAAIARGLPLPLMDSDQRVADLYGAQTTPHLFLIDRQGILRYQGAVDDVTFRQRTPTRNYAQEAITALLSGGQPNPEQTPPYGCAIVRDVYLN